MLNHHLGHLLGHDDVECKGKLADVMVVQEETLPEGCAVNPWPNPDAPAEYVEPEREPLALALRSRSPLGVARAPLSPWRGGIGT